uniref:FRIGIDA-like protein n=1 Tax=Noccaea caerulescens TaxID=107243 RepID=A0A1J3J2R1_NOCCA
MTASETIAAAIDRIDEKKEKLKKAFEDLQAHRSLLSPSFSLSWSEIDSHFSSLQTSLSNRFRLLQSASPLENDSRRLETADAGTSSEATVVRPELRSLCEMMDGFGLTKFLVDNWDDDAPPNLELSAAIRCSPDPATMVLDAIQGWNHTHTPSSGKSVDVRRVFVLLMEALIEINANITVNMSERAKKMARDWKTKINKKPFEALLFLHLVAAFELGSEFSSDELFDYVFMIARYKQSTWVCNKVGLDRGRVGNLIKKLLDYGKPTVAVRFMYECGGMTDGEFQPIPILKSYIKDCRESAHKLCAEDDYSLKSQNIATDKEVSALKAVVKIIKDHNLESEFREEKVEERVEELEKQKAQRKRSSSNPQQEPQKKGRKRPRDRYGTAPSQQQPFARPEATQQHGLQLNPFGLAGVVLPYMNPLAATPQSVYYGQQNGIVLPPQFHPAYYSQ